MEDLKTSIAAVKEVLASEPPPPGKKRGAKKVVKKVIKNGAAKKVAKKVDKVAKKAKDTEADPNVVTLAQLAEEAEIAPQSARVKLREAGVERPEGRWVWPVGSKALKEARKTVGLTG